MIRQPTLLRPTSWGFLIRSTVVAGRRAHKKEPSRHHAPAAAIVAAATVPDPILYSAPHSQASVETPHIPSYPQSSVSFHDDNTYPPGIPLSYAASAASFQLDNYPTTIPASYTQQNAAPLASLPELYPTGDHSPVNTRIAAPVYDSDDVDYPIAHSPSYTRIASMQRRSSDNYPALDRQLSRTEFAAALQGPGNKYPVSNPTSYAPIAAQVYSPAAYTQTTAAPVHSPAISGQSPAQSISPTNVSNHSVYSAYSTSSGEGAYSTSSGAGSWDGAGDGMEDALGMFLHATAERQADYKSTIAVNQRSTFRKHLALIRHDALDAFVHAHSAARAMPQLEFKRAMTTSQQVGWRAAASLEVGVCTTGIYPCAFLRDLQHVL